MPARPCVSVVIGIRNAGNALWPALRSILSVWDLEIEVIVVDDGSIDDTATRLVALSREDRRVRVFNQGKAGLTAALIRGCSEAHGEYVARQDIGDHSLPGRLVRQARVLDEYPDVVMVTCGYRLIGPQGEILIETLPRNSADAWTEILRGGNTDRLYGPAHGSVMFRKSTYDKIGGYRSEFYFAQDLDLWTRLAAVGRLNYVPEVLYEIGFSYDSLSARYGMQQRQLRELIAEATQRRARGESDDDLLLQAASIRIPASGAEPAESSVADADYFIGSCLAVRKDPAARRYFKQVLSKRPLHARAWAKLLRSYVVRPKAAE